MSQDQSDNKNWIDASASAAPTLLGAAAGVLVADLIHPESRRPVGLTLAALGVCALTPLIVGTVVDLVNGPNSRYGSRRTLRRIRDAGASSDEFADLAPVEEEQMFIG